MLSTVVVATVVQPPASFERWICTGARPAAGAGFRRARSARPASFSSTTGATSSLAIPLGLPPLVSRYDMGALAFAGIEIEPSGAVLTAPTGVQTVVPYACCSSWRSVRLRPRPASVTAVPNGSVFAGSGSSASTPTREPRRAQAERAGGRSAPVTVDLSLVADAGRPR